MIDGKKIGFSNEGVEVSIIDFTLSRLESVGSLGATMILSGWLSFSSPLLIILSIHNIDWIIFNINVFRMENHTSATCQVTRRCFKAKGTFSSMCTDTWGSATATNGSHLRQRYQDSCQYYSIILWMISDQHALDGVYLGENDHREEMQNDQCGHHQRAQSICKARLIKWQFIYGVMC